MLGDTITLTDQDSSWSVRRVQVQFANRRGERIDIAVPSHLGPSARASDLCRLLLWRQLVGQPRSGKDLSWKAPDRSHLNPLGSAPSM